MWEKFKLSLGKIVQGLLNIFKKKKDDNIQVGEWTVTWSDWEECNKKLPVQFKLELSDEEIKDMVIEELEKTLNTSRTFLPKPILVKTLLISCYGNWQHDSCGCDISRLNEGIAHYWCTSTFSLEKWCGEDEEWDGEEEIHTIVNSAYIWEADGRWYWSL
jgi:hypothetical protein